MWYVYLLQSRKTSRYYIGQTNYLKERFKDHNSGRVPSTRRDCPWELVGCEIYDSQSSARWRERQIKKHSGKREQFIQAFVSNKKRKCIK